MQQQQQQQAAAAGRAGGAAAALGGRGGSRAAASGVGGSGGTPNASTKKTVLGFRVAQPLGTIAYMSPESFVRGHTLGPGVDIYAFGILMYELLMCRAPYQGLDAQVGRAPERHAHGGGGATSKCRWWRGLQLRGVGMRHSACAT